MLFNSLTFVVFFLVVLLLYQCLGRSYRSQNIMLLIVSYIFYGWWDVRFLYLIVLCTVIDYCSSRLIDNGSLSVREFFKAFALIFLSSVFCVAFDWNGITILLAGLRPHIIFDWKILLPETYVGWWLPAITCLGGGVFALIILIVKSKYKNAPRLYLFFSVFVNLMVLGTFKYYNFFTENFEVLYQNLTGSTSHFFTTKIILPVGISFFTFQSISHSVDVYRKKIKATESILELATFISFFPQLVAGPIERGAHLLPQFQRPRKVTVEDWKNGLWLMTWGLYKKVVVADNLAVIVNQTFASASSDLSVDGGQCLLAIYAFAIQIYCDFSGYTDIARGAARLLGFDIMLNFNLPCIAVSPSDFWRRWHISLSSWLRDYLYIPLGGNRYGELKIYRNLLLTMVLGGLWHGAAWTFILWGIFHGFILVIYRFFGLEQFFSRGGFLRRIFAVLIMFHLVCFGWLLFRSQNFETVVLFITAIATDFKISSTSMNLLYDIIVYSWFLILFQSIQIYKNNLNPLGDFCGFIRLNVWLFLLISIISLAPRTAAEFIYFAF